MTPEQPSEPLWAAAARAAAAGQLPRRLPTTKHTIRSDSDYEMNLEDAYVYQENT